MKKEDKNAIIASLQEQLGQYSHFYLTNIEGLNAEKTSELRRACFKQDVKLLVAKNTLLQKALEAKGIDAQIFAALKGNTALMLSNTGNAPAKLIKEFTKKEKNKEEAKPQLKAAYVEETIYVGAQNLDFLATIKSNVWFQTHSCGRRDPTSIKGVIKVTLLLLLCAPGGRGGQSQAVWSGPP